MPKLRAVQPGEVEKYLKLLVYGAAGTWKTYNLCQFPHSYYFDLERGAEEKQYVDLLRKSKSLVFPTVDIDEVITEVTTLLSEQHDFKSVVIDPITTVFNDESDLQEKYVGSDYGKNVAEATKKWRRLGKLLKRLNMTVVVSAYEKQKFNSDGLMIPNGPRDIDHFFDVVLRTEKRGNEVVATVMKTRNVAFPDGAVFRFTFDEIVARYGREGLDRAAVPVVLASHEQLVELLNLLASRVDADSLKDKWLKAASAEELSEMRSEDVEKCIAYLKGKTTKVPAEAAA